MQLGYVTNRTKRTLTIACSILLSMATTLAPDELKEKTNNHDDDAASKRSRSERRSAAGRASLRRGRYLLSTRTDALSFPSTEDRNDMEKFLS